MRREISWLFQFALVNPTIYVLFLICPIKLHVSWPSHWLRLLPPRLQQIFFMLQKLLSCGGKFIVITIMLKNLIIYILVFFLICSAVLNWFMKRVLPLGCLWSQWSFYLNTAIFMMWYIYNCSLPNVSYHYHCVKTFTIATLSVKSEAVSPWISLWRIVGNPPVGHTIAWSAIKLCLQPLNSESFSHCTNVEDGASADVKARGFWMLHQDALFNVRVFYPNAFRNVQLLSFTSLL